MSGPEIWRSWFLHLVIAGKWNEQTRTIENYILTFSDVGRWNKQARNIENCIHTHSTLQGDRMRSKETWKTIFTQSYTHSTLQEDRISGKETWSIIFNSTYIQWLERECLIKYRWYASSKLNKFYWLDWNDSMKCSH